MKAYRKISISSSLKKLSLTPMEAFEIFSRSLLHSAFSKEHHPKPKSLGLFALMEKIKDLTASQLADFALNMFIHQGRHQIMAALIYRCLELDPRHPLGLRCLSDFLDWKGSESVSAIILEYIIQNNIPTSESSLKEHEQLLFRSKWVWGFSKHISGQTNLSMADFDDTRHGSGWHRNQRIRF